MERRCSGETVAINQNQVEARPGIAESDVNVQSIHDNGALNFFRRIVAATVKHGIRQRLLQRHQDVDLVAFIGAVLVDESHDLFARLGH